MSKPKLKRRVGFQMDAFGRARSLDRSGDWSPSIRREAQWIYLHCLSRACPAVLTTLRSVPIGDDAGVDAWLRQWSLLSSDADNWTRAHAVATQRACARYGVTCWFDRDDLKGMLCDEALPIESRPLRHHEHFVWLAHYQLGAQWNRVSDIADSKTVREAVTSLANRVKLQLRPSRRGRPTK